MPAGDACSAVWVIKHEMLLHTGIEAGTLVASVLWQTAWRGACLSWTAIISREHPFRIALCSGAAAS